MLSKVINTFGGVATKLRNWDDRRQDSTDLDACIASLCEATPSLPLAEGVRQAWEIGQKIDLTNIMYGPVHWKGAEMFRTNPEPYYYFLAGFVRHHKCSRILEIGTHFGGSIRAMQRGIDPELTDKSQLLTVDLTDLNPDVRRIPRLRKLTGDANSRVITEQVVAYFRNPIDLLYVDADHHFEPTLANVGIYCTLLRPSFVILDDIVLDKRMTALWNVLRVAFGANAVNCAEIVPIRPQGCGFGLLQLAH
jgi:cephalosporin hydroxylase